jgi:dTDP-4-amino-4,6-dideoxygalactose transaminase
MNSIPLVDLGAAHREIADEVQAGFAEVLDATAFIGGKQVSAFEEQYAAYVGVRHCVGVGNGTDALEFGLRGLGIRPDDEVILPANTFIATAEAVARAGAVPVLVDVLPDTLLIDPQRIPAAITKRTRVVLPVHLYGQSAAVEQVQAAIADYDIRILEDAAQSQGARRHGKGVGSLADAAGTSFYPGKNLGAYGDAGAVLTDDDELARQVRLLTNHGSEAKYQHSVLGFNSRLDTLQAVVLSIKLARLERWNEQRREAAARYGRLLVDLDEVVLPTTDPANEHAWHLYVVQVPRRDEVLRRLNAAGVGAGIHYPTPVHLHGAFADLNLGPGSFPVAEAAAGRILSIPLFPGITEAQQERVAQELRKALAT